MNGMDTRCMAAAGSDALTALPPAAALLSAGAALLLLLLLLLLLHSPIESPCLQMCCVRVGARKC